MVVHYSDCKNFYTFYSEKGHVPKTLCGRDMTHRYRYTEVSERVTCSRCKAALMKRQMLPGQANGAPIVVKNVSDIGTCGDEIHDSYLSRLGIC